DDEDIFYGPINNINQLGHVGGLVTRTPEHARVLAGGQPHGSTGFFFEPTLIADLEQDDELIQTEIFGPVVTAQRFKDEDEAIEFANGTEYALAASVWTGNVGRAARMAARLDFGCVWVNTTSRWLARCRMVASHTPGMARICLCTDSRTARASSTSCCTTASRADPASQSTSLTIRSS